VLAEKNNAQNMTRHCDLCFPARVLKGSISHASRHIKNISSRQAAFFFLDVRKAMFALGKKAEQEMLHNGNLCFVTHTFKWHKSHLDA
jgi:hypothetical protein